MKRIAWLTALLFLSATTGCVERRFTVFSDPPGAVCYYNGRYLGPTPTDGYLIYYGKQKFTLMKEGYETLNVVEPYYAPWFDLPGIDFVTENIYPFKLRDVRQIHYTMRPLKSIPLEEVRTRAEELRSRGQYIGIPAPPRPVASAPVPPPPPPPEGTLPPPRTVPETPPVGFNAPVP